MKRVSQYLFTIFLIFLTLNIFAKPGFIVMPFSSTVHLAPNSSATVLVVAQNNTTVNQTITNIAPIIPASSGISATVTFNNCGFLIPNDSCNALIKLQSGNQPSTGNLNISVCSFNGAFCSRITQPINLINALPISIMVTPTDPSIDNGTTQQFSAIALFGDIAMLDVTDSVTWNSSDTTKATISNANDSKGLATGVAPGVSTISATLGRNSGATTLTVTSATLTSISITPTNPSIAKGTNQQFTATGIFSDNTNEDITSLVTWNSSDTTVATISNVNNQRGLATGKNTGQTTITATLGGVSGSTTLGVTAATLTTISVTPTDPSIIVGTNQQFTATGIFSDNSVEDLTNSVTWKTQSALVAIISNQTGSQGLALGIKKGSTSVIATLGNISGSTSLQVTDAVLTEIDVTPFNVNIPVSSTQSYTATGIYNNGHEQDITTMVTWQSSNTSIATISNASGSQGLAKGIHPGNAIISATLAGVVGSTNLTIDNPTLVSITVTPTMPTIVNGTNQQFTATGIYSDSSVQDLTGAVTWFSNTSSVAVISNASGSKGLASSVAAGTSTISAQLNGVSGSTVLTVSPATLTSISITPPNSTIAKGTTQQFTATGFYSDNTNQNITSLVTWGSSNTTVATIANNNNQRGLATGVGVGRTSITATLGSISGSTILAVTAATLTSISVSPADPSIIESTTQQFTATGIFSDNSVEDLTNTVTWTTQSASVAIISNQTGSKGLALGIGAGSTNVIATLGTISSATTLSVTAATLTGIDVMPDNVTIPLSSEQSYTATGIYNNGQEQDITTKVTWQSSNQNIATISNAPGSQGLAKGIQPGSVTISATLAGVVGSTSLTIDNPTLLSITVLPTAPTIANGTNQQFTATGNYSDSSVQDLTDAVTWFSDTQSVAVISNSSGSKGLASSVGAGTSNISARLNGISGNTTLTVTAATLNSITVTPQNASVPININQPFKATGTYSDASTEDITSEVLWSSSSTSVATISNTAATKGIATGVAKGSTTISATSGSVTGSTTLNVFKAKIGDSLEGGVIACLGGGFNNLITANSNNSSGIAWGGTGTTTNAQSSVDGNTNTTKIVTTLTPGLTYAAGICAAYEIDSAGNTPCVGGNTCYNDWFLPAINQLSCMQGNRNQISGFTKTDYWSSTEDSSQPSTNALSLTFANNKNPVSNNKSETFAVRCVRIINAQP